MVRGWRLKLEFQPDYFGAADHNNKLNFLQVQLIPAAAITFNITASE